MIENTASILAGIPSSAFLRQPVNTPMNTLRTLFTGLALDGNPRWPETRVTAVVTDSRRVVPGAVFVALRGLRTDGNLHIEDAISRGAEAVVSEEAPSRLAIVPWLHVASARNALAEIASRFYDTPDETVQILGVTGTNGKTTVTMLAQHLLMAQKQSTGLIGTVRYQLGERSLPAYRTTPESVDIFSMLAQMRASGCRHATVEISSHGIEQGRINGLRIPVAAFLNLTQDHLDYHGDMETYFQAKRRLFDNSTARGLQTAILNLDDPYGARLADELESALQKLTFGQHPNANFRAADVQLEPERSRFTLHEPGGTHTVESTLLGSYNVSNILAALALVHAAGGDVASAVHALPAFTGVPGRMERVDGGLPFKVLVDYAHTSDALDNALHMLRQITPGRLLVVFGCGGDRDRAKRPLMSAAVQQLADESWATSDNPRKESLAQIFDDMRTGVTAPERIRFIDDRRHAISLALDAVRPGDTLLIAGKGHETFQEFADTVQTFDDRQTARELIQIKNLSDKFLQHSND